MFKRLARLLTLVLFPNLVFAQAPTVAVTTRAGNGAPLTFAQGDNNFLGLQHAANGGAQSWGHKETADSGLTFGYYGGVVWTGTAYVNIVDGTVALTASSTNYVQRTAAGVVSTNTSGWTAGQIPMYQVVTGSSSITTVVDQRLQGGAVAPSVSFQQSGTGAVVSTVDAKIKQFTISVKDFGAVGDGVTDDTTAIQAAATAAVAGNANLLFTPGTYKKTGLITCSGSITILAYGATINQTTAGVGGIAFTGSGPVTIFGGTWNGPQYTTSTSAEQCFSFTGASAASPFVGITIKNATIQTWGFYGVYGIYSSNILITNTSIKNIYYAGIQFLSSSFAVVNGCLVDTVVATPNAYGIGFTRNQVDSLTTDPQSSDFIVSNCNVRNIANWEGLDTHGGIRGTFIGNSVYNTFKGIGVVKAPGSTTAYAPQEIDVIGNNFDSANTGGTAGVGIDFNGAEGTVGTPVQTASGRVIGNTIARYGTSSNQVSGAMYLHDTKGLIVSGNRIVQPSPTGIEMYHDNYDLVLANNYIEDAWTNTVAGWSNGWGIYANSIYNTGTMTGNDIGRGSKSATYINTIGIDVSNSSNSSWSYLPGTNAGTIPIYDPSNIATVVIRNPSFTGASAVIPNGWTATTQSAGNNSTQVSTTAYVDKIPNTGNTLPANPTGTTSTASDVMMGLAGSITPIKYPRVLILVTGEVANNTAGDGAIVRLRTGTGTAPANGAAATGTQRGQSQIFNSVSAAQISGFSCTFAVTGLTLGTANWIDLSLQATTGGTATVTNVTVTAVEIP